MEEGGGSIKGKCGRGSVEGREKRRGGRGNIKGKCGRESERSMKEGGGSMSEGKKGEGSIKRAGKYKRKVWKGHRGGAREA